MKYIAITLVLVISSAAGAFAQLSKGNLFIGPSLATTTYNSITNDYNYLDSGFRKTTNKNFGISATPQLGVFITNHFVVGGSLGFGVSSDKQNINSSEGNIITNDTKKNTFTISVGSFARYYFFNAAPVKTAFFTQLDAGVGTGSGSTSGSANDIYSTSSSTGKTSNIFTWNAGGSVGITRFIQKNIGVDLFAGYDYGVNKSHVVNTTTSTIKSSGVNSVSTSAFDLSSHNNDFRFGIGFHWFLLSHRS